MVDNTEPTPEQSLSRREALKLAAAVAAFGAALGVRPASSIAQGKEEGKGEMKGVKIDDSLIKPSEKEIVEDLIVAAHADARRKAEALLQEKMKDVTGGLPLPPGMKLF